jgi:DNA-binding MarR family transcriptional regulator
LRESRFAAMSPDDLRAHREQVLLRLLIRVSQAETATLVDRLEHRGHRGVRPGYVALLANVDTEGTRLVDIAARTGNSRQAVSQMAADVEAKGFLERVPDPRDRRAVLLRHTARGRRLLADALELMDEIERGYEAVLGARRMRSLRRALQLIADAADAGGRFGASSPAASASPAGRDPHPGPA